MPITERLRRSPGLSALASNLFSVLPLSLLRKALDLELPPDKTVEDFEMWCLGVWRLSVIDQLVHVRSRTWLLDC